MKLQKILAPASPEEAEMASVAHDCLVATLDQSRADYVELIVDVAGADGRHAAPTLRLPPRALRFLADILRAMARQEPMVLVPQKHELTTQEAANLLNVSRPFLIKELEAGRIAHRKVNRHRRIDMKDLRAYQTAQQEVSKKTLDELARLTQDAGVAF